MRTLALRTRALVLRHPWLAQLSSPQAVLALTPNRLAAAERALTALSGLGLDADAMMTVFDTVHAYVHGRTYAEVSLRQLMEDQGWSGGQEPQVTWLLNTGRYPTFYRYALEGARHDDQQWQFETGLDCVLDGIATRMGIAADD
jgi:hypothetical protein